MTASTNSPVVTFVEAERVYMTPLIERWGLCAIARHDSFPGWAAVDYAADTVVVRLEYERGLIAFCVASAVEPDYFWPIEFVAILFPRIRLMSAGFQRLSLNEQSTFLMQYMQEIQRLFASEHYSTTREKLRSVQT